MIRYKKDDITSLSDLFQVWIGGYPEDDKEVRAFLKSSKLEKILGVNDVDAILCERAYFPKEVLPSVYMALPLNLEIGKQKFVVPFSKLDSLNNDTNIKIARSFCLSVSFRAALELQDECEEINKLKIEVQKLKKIEEQKALIQEHKAQVLAIKKEKKEKENAEKLSSKREKAEHEKLIKLQKKQELIEQKKAEDLEIKKKKLYKMKLQKLYDKRDLLKQMYNKKSELEQELVIYEAMRDDITPKLLKEKIKKSAELNKMTAYLENQEYILNKSISNARNEVYREKHRTKLCYKANLRRKLLKVQNPEALKLMDKENNAKADRKKISSAYYERHKDEIKQKSDVNPMVSVYKKRYKVKKRFQEKTGQQVLALLNGIINHKINRD